MNKDFSFFRSINPNLHINDDKFIAQCTPIPFSNETLQSSKSLMMKEGYFELPPQKYLCSVSEMALAIDRFKKNGIPPVYCYVYDEYWLLFYQLHNLVKTFLGDGYVRLPGFWAWHVDPKNDESGWKSHRDRGAYTLNEDKTPKTITLWVSLTDTNELNGCMYIIPADRDPDYGVVDTMGYRGDFCNIRALPAKAGTIICWNQCVLHWGSRTSNRATNPRISLSIEFQQKGDHYYDQPVQVPNYVPPFDEKLKLIEKQLEQYKHMYL